MLLDFTVQFLIEQPRDLVTFALDYFTRLHQSRRGQSAPEGIRGMGVQYSASGTATRSSASNSLLRPDQNHSEEDESMQSDDEITNYGMYYYRMQRSPNSRLHQLGMGGGGCVRRLNKKICRLEKQRSLGSYPVFIIFIIDNGCIITQLLYGINEIGHCLLNPS